jgi:hypothetical protein
MQHYVYIGLQNTAEDPRNPEGVRIEQIVQVEGVFYVLSIIISSVHRHCQDQSHIRDVVPIKTSANVWKFE